MGNKINRGGNAIAGLPRAIGTVGVTGLDILSVLDNIKKQGYEITIDTRTKLKEMRWDAVSKGSVIQKTSKAILSTIATPIVPLEWAVRTAIEPLRNGAKNLWGATVNFFYNIGNSVKKMFSKDNVWDFKFKHIEEKLEKNTISKMNRISKAPNRIAAKLFWKKKK